MTNQVFQKPPTEEVVMIGRMFCVTVLAVGMAGCKDESVLSSSDVAPVDGTLQKIAPAYGQGEIPVAIVLSDPNSEFSELTYFSGLVTYEFGDRGGEGQRAVTTCRITIAGELWPWFQTRCGWTVSGESIETIILDGSGSATIAKSYDIQGRTDGVRLYVVYRATSQTLALDLIMLKGDALPDA
jgi:hypothetical protein